MSRPILPRRPRDAHKGDFGRVFLLSGSVGYTGAPVLASRGALRGGAGLITLAVPQEIYPIVAVKCDEVMPWPWPEEDDLVVAKAAACDAVLIGPGLGQGERAERLTLRLLNELKCPIVLDADGLNILSRHIDILDKRQGLTVLTPHEGEFARLAGAVQNRVEDACAFAEQHHCVMVLKGHETVTAYPDGRCVLNTTGNPGMAKGGSGDVLAGLLTALVGQGFACAPEMAVWFHGYAGDLAAHDKGEYAMTITDLIEQLPYAMKPCEEE